MVSNQSIRKVGAHISAAGGLENAPARAKAIGCNCMQVFLGSPRVWSRKPLSELHLEKYYSEIEKNSISPIFTHSLYLINLVSKNPELVQKSKSTIIYDLEFDSLVRGSGVVVHLGSHQGRGWEAVKDVLAASIVEVLQQTPPDSTFLIENSAGQNGKLCSDFSEIKWLIDQVMSANDDFKTRLGWCFDTCHGFAAGYKLEETADTFDKLGLTAYLKCIHVNDSRDEFGSGRDRHANIGDGQFDQDNLKKFLTDTRITHIPIITEVPGLDKMGPDAENISRISALVQV